jgi:hypothetical protein
MITTKIKQFVSKLFWPHSNSNDDNQQTQEQLFNVYTFKVLLLLCAFFSSIASTGIVSLFLFAGVVDDVFHAAFSFVVSTSIVAAFMVVKVVGFESVLKFSKVIMKAHVKNKTTTNRGINECN